MRWSRHALVPPGGQARWPCRSGPCQKSIQHVASDAASLAARGIKAIITKAARLNATATTTAPDTHRFARISRTRGDHAVTSVMVRWVWSTTSVTPGMFSAATFSAVRCVSELTIPQK